MQASVMPLQGFCPGCCSAIIFMQSSDKPDLRLRTSPSVRTPQAERTHMRPPGRTDRSGLPKEARDGKHVSQPLSSKVNSAPEQRHRTSPESYSFSTYTGGNPISLQADRRAWLSKRRNIPSGDPLVRFDPCGVALRRKASQRS
jgi:hypothetical protein